MWLAAFLAASLGGDPDIAPLDAFTKEVDRIVLSGRQMPPALLLDVSRLPSAGDRMMALVYLRRTGLLTGPLVSLDRTVFLNDPAIGASPMDAAGPPDEN